MHYIQCYLQRTLSIRIQYMNSYYKSYAKYLCKNGIHIQVDSHKREEMGSSML